MKNKIFLIISLIFSLGLHLAPGISLAEPGVQPPPIMQLSSHVGVKPENIVQLNTFRGQGGVIEGWTLLRSDGTFASYNTSVNPFIVPDNTFLVITDVFMTSATTADGTFALSASNPESNNSSIVLYSVTSLQGTNPYVAGYRDHMTTGFIIPPGWKLDNPSGNIESGARLMGYFTPRIQP